MTQETNQEAEKTLFAQMVEAEGAQLVHDLAHHLGDQLFDVIKRNALLMKTGSGAIAITVLSSIFILRESIGFYERVMIAHQPPATQDELDYGKKLIVDLFLQCAGEDITDAIKEILLASTDQPPHSVMT